jgi:hypothetical protein
MLSIDQYIDDAKKARNLGSDRALSRALGRSGNVVTHWRCKRAWPSPDTMVDLATLGGHDPAEALADLAVWSAAGKAKTIYLEMRNTLFPALFAALFSIEQVTNKGASILNTLYIMLNSRFSAFFNHIALNDAPSFENPRGCAAPAKREKSTPWPPSMPSFVTP